MRAHLETMQPGQEFHFLCLPKMAESMEEVVPQSGGVIVGRDVRSFGVLLTVGKR